MEFTKISVLVPTRQRVHRLQTLLSSFGATIEDSDLAEVVFRIDDDDVDTRAFMNGHRRVTGPRLNGYWSMSTFFNEMAAVAVGDVLMCGNDDMVFRTPGWPRMVLDAANEHPDGLFNLGVSTFNETHYPFSIVSRVVVGCLGFLWDPRIFWGDIFLRDVMAAFGRCRMLPEVRIDHDWVGYAPDRVFLEGNQQGIMVKDPTYWSGTHLTCVNEAVNKLKTVVGAA